MHRGTCSGDHQFMIAFEHHLDGTPGLFRKLSARDSPRVSAKLATEAATHYGRNNFHLIAGNADSLADFAADAADVLRRSPHREAVPIPFGNLAVRFHAAVRNYVRAITAFVRDLSLLKSRVGVTRGFLGEILCEL